MPVEARGLYRSPNGDRWLLVRDPGPGRVFARHEPNAPSGGRASDAEVGDFLARGGGRGPERRELLPLTGTRVEGGARHTRTARSASPDPHGPDRRSGTPHPVGRSGRAGGGRG
jgi:hypothetical protein